LARHNKCTPFRDGNKVLRKFLNSSPVSKESAKYDYMQYHHDMLPPFSSPVGAEAPCAAEQTAT